MKLGARVSKIISERNELKRNSIESKLRDVINNLIERGSNGSNDLKSYAFYNEDIWTEAKTVMSGLDCQFKQESFYSIELGTISHKYITSIYKSKFKAEPFKIGSGNETKRGLRFSKKVLDRLVIHYDVPDEIVILDQTDKPESKGSATDATLATHFENGDGQNGLMDDGNRNIRSSDPVPSAIKVEPDPGAEAVTTQIDPITEHEYDKDTGVVCDNNDSIDRNDNKLGTEVNGKEACPFPKCVASVASVAEIHNNDDAMPAIPITNGNDAVKDVDLPILPCPWCDYKHQIEFDLGNHLLASHRDELLKSPIGRGSMENRIDYAIQRIKREIAGCR